MIIASKEPSTEQAPIACVSPGANEMPNATPTLNDRIEKRTGKLSGGKLFDVLLEEYRCVDESKGEVAFEEYFKGVSEMMSTIKSMPKNEQDLVWDSIERRISELCNTCKNGSSIVGSALSLLQMNELAEHRCLGILWQLSAARETFFDWKVLQVQWRYEPSHESLDRMLEAVLSTQHSTMKTALEGDTVETVSLVFALYATLYTEETEDAWFPHVLWKSVATMLELVQKQIKVLSRTYIRVNGNKRATAVLDEVCIKLWAGRMEPESNAVGTWLLAERVLVNLRYGFNQKMLGDTVEPLLRLVGRMLGEETRVNATKLIRACGLLHDTAQLGATGENGDPEQRYEPIGLVGDYFRSWFQSNERGENVLDDIALAIACVLSLAHPCITAQDAVELLNASSLFAQGEIDFVKLRVCLELTGVFLHRESLGDTRVASEILNTYAYICWKWPVFSQMIFKQVSISVRIERGVSLKGYDANHLNASRTQLWTALFQGLHELSFDADSKKQIAMTLHALGGITALEMCLGNLQRPFVIFPTNLSPSFLKQISTNSWNALDQIYSYLYKAAISFRDSDIGDPSVRNECVRLCARIIAWYEAQSDLDRVLHVLETVSLLSPPLHLIRTLPSIFDGVQLVFKTPLEPGKHDGVIAIAIESFRVHFQHLDFQRKVQQTWLHLELAPTGLKPQAWANVVRVCMKRGELPGGRDWLLCLLTAGNEEIALRIFKEAGQYLADDFARGGCMTTISLCNLCDMVCSIRSRFPLVVVTAADETSRVCFNILCEYEILSEDAVEHLLEVIFWIDHPDQGQRDLLGILQISAACCRAWRYSYIQKPAGDTAIFVPKFATFKRGAMDTALILSLQVYTQLLRSNILKIKSEPKELWQAVAADSFTLAHPSLIHSIPLNAMDPLLELCTQLIDSVNRENTKSSGAASDSQMHAEALCISQKLALRIRHARDSLIAISPKRFAL